MKITLLYCGKTTSTEISAICKDYLKRIQRYAKTEEIVIESRNRKKEALIKEDESAQLLKKIAPADFVILLDDKGKEFTSVQFASYMQSVFNQSHKNICFVTGGAYGFSEALYRRADFKLSLSKMTFSHQIIRPLFLEQLYRAFTIINHEPYHHE